MNMLNRVGWVGPLAGLIGGVAIRWVTTVRPFVENNLNMTAVLLAAITILFGAIYAGVGAYKRERNSLDAEFEHFPGQSHTRALNASFIPLIAVFAVAMIVLSV